MNVAASYQCGLRVELFYASLLVATQLRRVFGFNVWWVPVQGYISVATEDLYFSVKTLGSGAVNAPPEGITLYLANVSLSPA